MLKVLVVASWYPTSRHPSEGVFIRDQVDVLRRVYDVTVIAPELITLGALVRPRSIRQEPMLGAPVLRPRVPSPIPGRPGIVAGLYARAVQLAARRLIVDRGEPDVIHAHVAMNAGYAAVRLAAELGCPLILTEHASPQSTYLRPVFGWDLVTWSIQRTDHLIGVSPAVVERLRQAGGERVHLVPNVVDTDFFVPGPPGVTTAPIRFLSVGAVTRPKGVDVLLEACQTLLREGGSRWSLALVGARRHRRQLETEVRRYGLGEHVEVIGEVPRSTIRDLLDASDCAVLPSRSETFGLAAAEAMAMGIPVIAARNAGHDFVVPPDLARLVDAGDPYALSSAMAEVVRGTWRPDRVALRDSIVSRFGPAAFLERIGIVYREAVPDHPFWN